MCPENTLKYIKISPKVQETLFFENINFPLYMEWGVWQIVMYFWCNCVWQSKII